MKNEICKFNKGALYVEALVSNTTNNDYQVNLFMEAVNQGVTTKSLKSAKFKDYKVDG